MSDAHVASGWIFYRFGMLVTGKGEGAFLPSLMRSLASTGNCTFQVIGIVPQRSPITSQKKKLKMIGSGNPDTCASLRTLFKWCWRAKRDSYSARFQLEFGSCSPVTEHQIETLRQDNPA